MVTPALLLAHYIVFISAPIMLSLVVFFFFRYMRENSYKIEIQSLPLIISLFVFLSFFGVVTVLSELGSWNNLNPGHIKAKYAFVFFFVVIAILEFIVVVSSIVFFVATGGTKGLSVIERLNLFLNVVVLLLIPPGLFAILWFIICSFATLLFGLAYPLHTFSLVVLHMGFVYIIIVVYAIVIASVWKKTKSAVTIACIIALCAFLVVYICIGYAGIIITYFLTVIQGYIRTDGAPNPGFVLILPSLALFLIGWLLRRFFNDSINGETHTT